MHLNRFPRRPLTFGPTPIHPLPRLSAALGGRVELWAKREDCNSGLAFGGNKLRKLEYLIPEALSEGCDTLVSIGGVQSNHTRQVAAVAAHLGMDCVLVQGSWVNGCSTHYGDVGNPLLSRVLGARMVFVNEAFTIASKVHWEQALEELRRAGKRPYGIPVGASDHPLGSLGYVAFAEEVRRQERELGSAFDFIVMASASGSTQAGMVVGFAQDGRAQHVIGIDVTAAPEATRAQVLRLAQRTSALLEASPSIHEKDVVLLEDYAGPEYGVPSLDTVSAIQTCARLEGMLTDPVYEGKSMQGLMDLVTRGFFPEGSRVLYVHLGGTPALDAYSECFA